MISWGQIRWRHCFTLRSEQHGPIRIKTYNRLDPSNLLTQLCNSSVHFIQNVLLEKRPVAFLCVLRHLRSRTGFILVSLSFAVTLKQTSMEMCFYINVSYFRCAASGLFKKKKRNYLKLNSVFRDVQIKRESPAGIRWRN